jgi:thiamine-phosphate pyrophosphorylase
VTDRRSLAGSPDALESLLLEKIEEAVRVHVDWIQLREKDLSGSQLAVLSEQAVKRTGQAGRVLVNDRLDVAFTVNAAGVHLGEKGLPVGAARRLAEERSIGREFLVGVSRHSVEGALEAERAGADYVIFGPVFATPSKAEFGQPQGLERLKHACERLKIPVLAIGGITEQNAWACFAAGAQGIAAIRLFQNAKDLGNVVKKLRETSSGHEATE